MRKHVYMPLLVGAALVALMGCGKEEAPPGPADTSTTPSDTQTQAAAPTTCVSTAAEVEAALGATVAGDPPPVMRTSGDYGTEGVSCQWFGNNGAELFVGAYLDPGTAKFAEARAANSFSSIASDVPGLGEEAWKYVDPQTHALTIEARGGGYVLDLYYDGPGDHEQQVITLGQQALQHLAG